MIPRWVQAMLSTVAAVVLFGCSEAPELLSYGLLTYGISEEMEEWGAVPGIEACLALWSIALAAPAEMPISAAISFSGVRL